MDLNYEGYLGHKVPVDTALYIVVGRPWDRHQNHLSLCTCFLPQDMPRPLRAALCCPLLLPLKVPCCMVLPGDAE